MFCFCFLSTVICFAAQEGLVSFDDQSHYIFPTSSNEALIFHS